jgi:hypothetical protein
VEAIFIILADGRSEPTSISGNFQDFGAFPSGLQASAELTIAISAQLALAPIARGHSMTMLYLFSQFIALVPSEGGLQRYVVEIYACNSDNHCSGYRQPFDADNDVGCQMTSFMAATRWQIEHPGLKLKTFHCALANEHAT